MFDNIKILCYNVRIDGGGLYVFFLLLLSISFLTNEQLVKENSFRKSFLVKGLILQM